MNLDNSLFLCCRYFSSTQQFIIRSSCDFVAKRQANSGEELALYGVCGRK